MRYRAGDFSSFKDISLSGNITLGGDILDSGNNSVFSPDGSGHIDGLGRFDAELNSPSLSVRRTFSPADTGVYWVAGTGTISPGGYLGMTASVQAVFPLSGILSHLMLKGTFQLESIKVYYYTPVAAAYITATYFRKVNATTRTVTEDPTDLDDKGNGSSGNASYVFTIDKTLDLDYYYQLKISMLYASATNYINAFEIRGKFV